MTINLNDMAKELKLNERHKHFCHRHNYDVGKPNKEEGPAWAF